MSLLSHGGNFGCFTRLRFKGVCLLTTVRQTSYHVAKALSGSVQFRTSMDGAQCRSVQNALLSKCLQNRNSICEWFCAYEICLEGCYVAHSLILQCDDRPHVTVLVDWA